jgi:hypothetical protein
MKLRRVVKIIAISASVLLLLSLLVIAIASTLARRVPNWYAAGTLDEPTRQALQNQVQQSLARLNNELGQAVVQAQRGEGSTEVNIELTEEQVNALWQNWAGLSDLPSEIKDRFAGIQVRFEADRVVLAATTPGQVVLQVSVEVAALPDGSEGVVWNRINAGSLPLPIRMIRGQLAPVFARLDTELPARDAQVDLVPLNEAGLRLAAGMQLRDLLEGDRVALLLPLMSSYSTGGVTPEPVLVSVRSLMIQPGILRATLVPLTPAQQREVIDVWRTRIP